MKYVGFYPTVALVSQCTYDLDIKNCKVFHYIQRKETKMLSLYHTAQCLQLVMLYLILKNSLGWQIFVVFLSQIIIIIIIIKNIEDGRKLLELMYMFMEQNVIMVSHMYIYLQTHQVVYIKFVQLFVCQPYLDKVVKILFSHHYLCLYSYYRK